MLNLEAVPACINAAADGKAVGGSDGAQGERLTFVVDQQHDRRSLGANRQLDGHGCQSASKRGSDADFILADLKARGVAAVIPAKRNLNVRPVIDGHIYSLRNLVERCFSKLKHSRRLATRYAKTADSFLGLVVVASIRLWIRHFVHTA